MCIYIYIYIHQLYMYIYIYLSIYIYIYICMITCVYDINNIKPHWFNHQHRCCMPMHTWRCATSDPQTNSKTSNLSRNMCPNTVQGLLSYFCQVRSCHKLPQWQIVVMCTCSRLWKYIHDAQVLKLAAALCTTCSM